ncbi:MAG: hypothetical protein D6679_13335 [Candidatus Hydrogenedentota bacterium]|nr:MAG: hypothetical protein D6679_13335 [Candidatus Hydrogenedentota bacterium]
MRKNTEGEEGKRQKAKGKRQKAKGRRESRAQTLSSARNGGEKEANGLARGLYRPTSRSPSWHNHRLQRPPPIRPWCHSEQTAGRRKISHTHRHSERTRGIPHECESVPVAGYNVAGIPRRRRSAPPRSE